MLTDEQKKIILNAAMTGDVKILEKVPVESLTITNQTGASLAHLAAINGRLGAIKFLDNNGIPLDTGDKQGKTPLHYAIHAGHYEIADTLVLRNANLGARDNTGHTPFEYDKRRIQHAEAVSYEQYLDVDLGSKKDDVEYVYNFLTHYLPHEKKAVSVAYDNHIEMLNTAQTIDEIIGGGSVDVTKLEKMAKNVTRMMEARVFSQKDTEKISEIRDDIELDVIADAKEQKLKKVEGKDLETLRTEESLKSLKLIKETALELQHKQGKVVTSVVFGITQRVSGVREVLNEYAQKLQEQQQTVTELKRQASDAVSDIRGLFERQSSDVNVTSTPKPTKKPSQGPTSFVR